MGFANIGAFRALRTLRALRPLRAVSRWEGMKVHTLAAFTVTIRVSSTDVNVWNSLPDTVVMTGRLKMREWKNREQTFPVLRFPALRSAPDFSTPAFFTPAFSAPPS